MIYSLLGYIPSAIVSFILALIKSEKEPNKKNTGINIYWYLVKCHCENENGFKNENGIMCEGIANFYKKTSCQSSEWCTGSSNQISSVESYRTLCEEGMRICEMIEKILSSYFNLFTYVNTILTRRNWLIFVEIVNCGNGHKAPRCSLCMESHKSKDNIYQSWCNGNCYYDEEEAACKEITSKFWCISFVCYI